MAYEPALAPDLDIIAYLLRLPPHLRRDALESLSQLEREALDCTWPGWAHEGQLAPPGDWASWVLKAGRGYGKTLAGAQWITSLVALGEPIRIALVGASLEDVRRVMIEGNSGLLEVADPWVSGWYPSLRRLKFTTGAEAAIFSGASPEMLRGPEHHYAWCDELAKWARPQECWDMLQFGLRLGRHPRALVTTTPRPGPVLKAIMEDPETVTTGGPTSANPHISPAYQRRVAALYAGTRLGRQELDGELLPDAAGALWSVELIERCRLESPSPSGEGLGWGSASGDLPGGQAPPPTPPLKGRGEITQTLIAVDPPSGDGTCGIVACARDAAGIAHILADHSVTARTPEGWAAAVTAAADAHGTLEVIAEANQGGAMVRTILRTAGPHLRVRLVNATRSKSQRAEPVAHLFEARKVVLHGRMPELETQLRGMVAGGGYEGPGLSPDRADAMVWGVTELMLTGRGDGPRVRVL
jgi:phage terminase large subunit-like protein